MTEQQAIPDIERAACTILAQQLNAIWHPMAREYVSRITETLDYAENPVAVNVSREAEDLTRENAENGYRMPVESRGTYDLLGAAVDHRLYARDGGDFSDPRQRRYITVLTEMCVRLAGEVATFRRRGRPSGDQVTEIHFGSEPVAAVSTSLAAEVATFANRALDLAAEMMVD